MKKALYIMIGGFLGAGKSTAISRLARRLNAGGLRVGLITNDQGSGLVDTSNLRSQGFKVEEIAGGCFCCRFDSLLTAARKLTAESRPDVFIAEPVGSCTDLVATVSYPLRRIYGEDFTIAPLSVVVDPIRARRMLGLEPGRAFSGKVAYIYRKQLEEADFIALNKRDLLNREESEALRTALARDYPAAELFEVSARFGDGLEAWFAHLAGEEMRDRKTMELDYDAYAEGEALLGWLNCTLELSSAGEPAGASLSLDGNAVLRDLAGGLHRRLGRMGAEVAHLKMTLLPADASEPGGPTDIGLISLVRQDFVPELSQELAAPVRSAELVINLRAEAEPLLLRRLVEEELESYRTRSGINMRLEHLESFRPGRPVPTHRMISSS